MTEPSKGRSPIAVAFAWSHRITSIALGMVLPGLLGLWVDLKLLGTKPLFTVLGFVLGMVAGLWHLIRMTSSKDEG